jgi:exopolysaccharide production protein ExoZ
MKSGSRIKLDGLEALRGIAALVVVLHHAFGIVAQPQNYGITLLDNIFGAGHLGVDIFFVLSGFVIAYSNPKGARSAAEITLYALRRFARIYPIYWIACLVFIPLYYLFSRGEEGDFSAARIIYNTLLFPSFRNPIIGVAWTLQYEAMFYLLFIPLLWRRKVGVVLWGILSGAILFVSIKGLTFSNPWMAQLFSPYVFEFIGGVAVWKLYSVHAVSWAVSKSLVIAGAALILLTVFLEQKFGRTASPWHLMYAAAAMPVVYGSVCLSALNGVASPNAFEKLLGFLGRYSYSIYLFHYPIEQIAARLALKITGPAPEVSVVWLVVTAVLISGLGIGILVGRFVEMPLLEWCKIRISGLKLRPAD